MLVATAAFLNLLIRGGGGVKLMCCLLSRSGERNYTMGAFVLGNEFEYISS
jgi:hypothetical protein